MVGGPNTQPCLESRGWDHSPVVFELLPTSRPPGIRPGMTASRERGSSLAGSQLTVPELSAGRQARQG